MRWIPGAFITSWLFSSLERALFKMDVINIISKVEGLPDAPITEPDQEHQPASTLFANG
jgi:hypothetical protein